VRLRTLADVFAYAAAEGIRLRLDRTEIRVRRPRAGRPGRKAFISGKLKQNTIKTTVASDGHGGILWCGARPGRMHDVTAVRTEGIDALLAAYRRSTCWSIPAINVWPETIPTRSPHRHPSPIQPRRWPVTSNGRPHAKPSPRNASRSNTRSPRRSGGASCNASPAAANYSQKPSTPSPASSPTVPSPGKAARPRGSHYPFATAQRSLATTTIVRTPVVPAGSIPFVLIPVGVTGPIRVRSARRAVVEVSPDAVAGIPYQRYRTSIGAGRRGPILVLRHR
jgi:hypothetical protein